MINNLNGQKMSSLFLQEDRLHDLSDKSSEAILAGTGHQIGHILVVIAKRPKERSSEGLIVLKSTCGQDRMGRNPSHFLISIFA